MRGNLPILQSPGQQNSLQNCFCNTSNTRSNTPGVLGSTVSGSTFLSTSPPRPTLLPLSPLPDPTSTASSPCLCSSPPPPCAADPPQGPDPRLPPPPPQPPPSPILPRKQRPGRRPLPPRPAVLRQAVRSLAPGPCTWGGGGGSAGSAPPPDEGRHVLIGGKFSVHPACLSSRGGCTQKTRVKTTPVLRAPTCLSLGASSRAPSRASAV